MPANISISNVSIVSQYIHLAVSNTQYVIRSTHYSTASNMQITVDMVILTCGEVMKLKHHL